MLNHVSFTPRKERQQRVKDFKNAEATMLAALDKLKETFSEDPTQHPDYNRFIDKAMD